MSLLQCRNKVFIQDGKEYKLIMHTDLCIEEILEAISPYYRKHKVLITDDSGKVLFKTR